MKVHPIIILLGLIALFTVLIVIVVVVSTGKLPDPLGNDPWGIDWYHFDNPDRFNPP